MAQADFLSDLAAAQSAQAPQGSFLADLATAPPAPKPTAPTAAPSGPDWGTIGNAAASAILRPAITAATAIPGMAADAVAGAADLAAKPFGVVPFRQMPSQALGNVVNRFVPRSNTAGAKIAEGVDSLLAGSKVPTGLESLIAKAPNAFVRGVSDNPQAALAAATRSAPGLLAPGLTSAQQAAAQGGAKLGMKTSPGQGIGSKALQQIETWAQSHPWTSGPFTKLAAGNQQVLNRTAAESIGENSPVVDANTLSNAARNLGDTFANVRTSKQSIPVNPQETTDFLKNLDEENEGLLPNDAKVSSHPLVKTLQGIMSRAAGKAGDRDAFMHEFNATTSAAPGNAGTRLLGGTSIRLIQDAADPNAVHIATIEAPKGTANLPALRKVLTLADQHGIPLTTDVSAFGDQRIPTETLAAHYSNAGFKPTGEADEYGIASMRRDPQVTAKQLGQLSSKLGRAAQKQMTTAGGDRDLGQALNAVKGHVDDLLARYLSPAGKEAYAAAKTGWRNLIHLTGRANVVNPSTGNVNGIALASRLQQADRPGFLYGRNQSPLYAAARFAQAFKPIVGDSGTATRSVNPFNPLELAYGVPMNLLSRFYLSPLGSATARGAAKALTKAGAVAPAVAKKTALNPVIWSALNARQ